MYKYAIVILYFINSFRIPLEYVNVPKYKLLDRGEYLEGVKARHFWTKGMRET